MDNVTYRRPVRTNSLNDLTIMTSESNERTLLDTTMMSIPDSLHDNSNVINDLNEQVKLLTTQLQSAHQEIENLNSENFRLKCDLNNMIEKNETLKKVCSTPVRKNTTPKSSTKSKQPQNKEIKFNSPNITDIKKDIETQVNLCNCTQKSQKSNSENTSKTKLIHPKNKLCIFSCNRSKGLLPIIEETFSSHFDYCHYLLPNNTITEAMADLENKLKDFTLSDYCIFVIGENDIKSEDNYVNTIQMIKERLQKVTHTNKIICVPTYITGAQIYNYKVELFNNLLHLDIENNNYAYLFDSNHCLTLDMFSQISGKINKQGIRNIYKCILQNIMVDISTPDSNTQKSSDCVREKESDMQLFL